MSSERTYLELSQEGGGSHKFYEVVVDGKSGLTGLPLQQSYIRHGFRDVWSFRLGGGGMRGRSSAGQSAPR